MGDKNKVPANSQDDIEEFALPEPDEILLPKGLRRFNSPGYFATLIGKEVTVDVEEDWFDPSARIVDAFIASLVATLVVFPLDVIKTRQQMTRPWEPPCNGIFQCLKQIQRKEGIRGLFRGATIVVVMTTPEKALKQVSNEYFRLWITDRGDNNSNNPLKKRTISLKEEVFAGFATGLLPMLVNSPADMIKGHLQDAGRLEKPKMSSWQILRHTMKTCGLYGLYAGAVTSITREVIFSAGYFPLMEHIRMSGIFGAYTKDQSLLSSTFIAGLVAASVMAWITTPLEVVATRIQMSSMIILQPIPDKLAPEASAIINAVEKEFPKCWNIPALVGATLITSSTAVRYLLLPVRCFIQLGSCIKSFRPKESKPPSEELLAAWQLLHPDWPSRKCYIPRK